MKLGYIKLFIIEFIIFISLLFNKFIYGNTMYTIMFLLSLFIGLVFFVGYEKDKYLYKTDIIQNIAILCIIYYICAYILGLFIGFLKNSYNLQFLSILNNSIPYLLIITLIELIRYVIISKGKEKKYIVFIITFLITIMDVIMNHGNYGFSSLLSSFHLISIYVLPAITKNILLTYLTYNYGYKPSIFYRIIMEIPLFLIPIFPDFGNYLLSIIRLLFPALIYYKTNNMLIKKEKLLINSKNNRLVFNSILVIIMFIIVYFTCGLFRYYAIAIGSKSMTPNINLGDVVIVEKIKQNNLNTLKEGDVLVYRHDDRTIVHRIVAISKYNNKFIVRTKGDHNVSNDGYDIASEDIIGKVNLKISYIGYPVVWIKQIFKK